MSTGLLATHSKQAKKRKPPFPPGLDIQKALSFFNGCVMNRGRMENGCVMNNRYLVAAVRYQAHVRTTSNIVRGGCAPQAYI